MDAQEDFGGSYDQLVIRLRWNRGSLHAGNGSSAWVSDERPRGSRIALLFQTKVRTDSEREYCMLMLAPTYADLLG